MRHYVIGQARPGEEKICKEQATSRAIPRPPSHLISAPLQSTPPETAATILRETRGKEGTRRPPFPGQNDPATALAVKAEPFGCAPRSL
jgi:hypothetical protein